MRFNDILGKKVLIVGDSRKGKTASTERFFREAVGMGYNQCVTVIDMAPNTVSLNGLSAGGKMSISKECGIRYLNAEDIRTPRLSAKNGKELLKLADYNRKLIEDMLEEFVSHPTSILFVNDVSIYLQRGSLARLLSAFEKASTVVANGYLGSRLEEDLGTGISDRERRFMKDLAARMDICINL